MGFNVSYIPMTSPLSFFGRYIMIKYAILGIIAAAIYDKVVSRATGGA